jgi:hypothetical protein
MGLLSNRISREDLRPGDHIYSWRTAYTYAHHGIYVEDSNVIHFTRGSDELVETGTFLGLSSSSTGRSNSTNACEICGYQPDKNGVICSCLDCFLDGGPLYRFEYAVNPVFFLAKVRGGTCTLADEDPAETVVRRATYLLQKGFGFYNIFKNNCEDFAIYCKTSLLVMEGINVGRSGQAASILSVLVAICSSPLRFLTTSIPGVTAVAGGLYCISRLVADIGLRRDVAKIAVENLTERLGLSESEVLLSSGAEPVLQLQF